jgi:hypothetical protein
MLTDEYAVHSRSVQQSINNLSIKHRKNPVYTDVFFNAPEGKIMKQLKNAIVLKEKEKITKYVTTCISMALIADKVK